MGGGAAAGGDFDALLVQSQNTGWRGLFKNGRCLALALFASLGGVLYGYNQGVFGQVQVMAEFNHRYSTTVCFRSVSECTSGAEEVVQLSNSTTKGLLTSILELGAFLGSLCAGPLSDIYSRKVRATITHLTLEMTS